jgi:hypothetical protein
MLYILLSMRDRGYLECGYHGTARSLEHFLVRPVRMLFLDTCCHHIVPPEEQDPKSQQGRVLVSAGIT